MPVLTFNTPTNLTLPKTLIHTHLTFTGTDVHCTLQLELADLLKGDQLSLVGGVVCSHLHFHSISSNEPEGRCWAAGTGIQHL
jgi:hypothetical protein